MPYAEVKRALEQEAQMYNTAARSASPCRLSPREFSKAAPQPDMSAARYSVPPGKYCSSVQWLLAIWLQMLDMGGLISWMKCSSRTCPCFFKITLLFLYIPSLVIFSWDSLGHWDIYVDTCILWHWLASLLRVQELCKNLEISILLHVSQKFRSLRELESVNVSQIMWDAKRTYNWFSVMSVYSPKL